MVMTEKLKQELENISIASRAGFQFVDCPGMISMEAKFDC
jgi:hypothetical protein